MKIEHSSIAYIADHVFYGIVILVLAVVLGVDGTRPIAAELFGLVLLGLLTWTVAEYGIHRFILHGPQPFRRWHDAHHQRPMALISAPTLLSGSLIGSLVFLPAWWAFGILPACAFTLGMLGGYLGYSLVHHATHHVRARSAWLKRTKLWHARHHHGGPAAEGCYGVTSPLWDYVFGTTRRGIASGIAGGDGERR